MDSNWPKIDFSDMEFWLLSENRLFRPQILKINKTKYTLPKTTLNTACNDVLIIFLGRLWLTQLNIEFYSKVTLFLDIYFCMDIMRGIVREDILIAYFGSTWLRVTNRIADTSTERTCQSKWWHKRMETKRIFLNHF